MLPLCLVALGCMSSRPRSKLDESSQGKKQNVATGSLRDKLHTQDFGKISFRASKIMGPISQSSMNCGHPATHETCIACVSSLAHCWFSAHPLQRAMHRQRFHTESHEQMCRVGYRTLSLATTNALCRTDMFISFWRQATVPPRKNHLSHDLITHVFLRSFQHGIVVMELMYAHHQLR